MTTATKGEGEMTCPNTDGGAHGDRGHCVWQQMLCDSHQVISSTIFIIKIIIIWQQKQLAPKPTLSLSSLLWAVFTGVFFYISQSSPIRKSKIYADFVLVLFHFPLKSDFDGYLPDMAGLNTVTIWKLCKEIDIYRTVDSSSTRMSGAAGGYQCSDDNDGD